MVLDLKGEEGKKKKKRRIEASTSRRGMRLYTSAFFSLFLFVRCQPWAAPPCPCASGAGLRSGRPACITVSVLLPCSWLVLCAFFKRLRSASLFWRRGGGGGSEQGVWGTRHTREPRARRLTGSVRPDRVVRRFRCFKNIMKLCFLTALWFTQTQDGAVGSCNNICVFFPSGQNSLQNFERFNTTHFQTFTFAPWPREAALNNYLKHFV